MTEAVVSAGGGAKPTPRWLRALKALRHRKMLAMLLLSFAAGLPYGAVLGTLNAWLTQEGITPAAIGVLSFIILAYSYKFIWSPGFQKAWFPKFAPPFLAKLGPRRAWLISLQLLIALLLGVLSFTQPASAIGYVALIGVIIAITSATHDIVLDAWRIEIAESSEDIDLMSALYQFGYRIAGLLTGLIALVMAQRIGWPITYGFIALGMALAALGTLAAPEPDHAARQQGGRDARPTYSGPLGTDVVRWSVGAVMVCWAIAIGIIVWFVVASFSTTPPPNPNTFTRDFGPVIILLSVVIPTLVAAYLLRRSSSPGPHTASTGSRLDKATDALFHTVLDPLMDLVQRMRWAVILVMALVLSYRFVDLVWGAFAYPFYLGTENGALAHTNDDVAIASKTIGVIMTVAGAAIGATALLFIGRMPCLLLGAILAAVTNLLFADLAAGGAGMDAFLAFTHLDQFWAIFGADQRLSRLITAIAGENLAVGFASVASVAYLTSIVNPRFAAVQYSLLASLTMLIGSLGRAPLGEMIETQGFHDVFVLTTWLGLVAVALSAAEWARQSMSAKPAAAKPAPAPAE